MLDAEFLSRALSSGLGSFIGVIVAFALNSLNQRRVDGNTRSKYLSMLGRVQHQRTMRKM